MDVEKSVLEVANEAIRKYKGCVEDILKIFRYRIFVNKMGGWTRILASTENKNVNRLVYLTRSLSSLATATIIGVAYYAYQRKSEQYANLEPIETDPQFKASAFKLAKYKGYVVSQESVLSGVLEKISQMKVQKQDVFVASFPKSGTTWLQQVVYLLYNPEDSQEENMETKFPYLEHVYPGFNEIEKKLGKRRFIKTHLPMELLPTEINQAKVLFIHRNPKDVIVSYYYFARMLRYVHYVGSLVDFAWLLMHNKLPYTPFFNHLNGYLKASVEKPQTFKVVSYEDMKSEPKKVIEDIASFLDIQVTPEQVEAIAEATSFEAMKANPSTNYSHWDQYGLRVKNECEFMRKGQVGDYKNHLDCQMQNNIDDWINLHLEAFPLIKSKYASKE